MDIDATITPEVERELVAMAPWMHHYRFAPDVIVGYFKYHGITETVCVSASPAEVKRRMQAAYAEHESGDQEWQVRELARRVDLSAASCLDIASATGRFSFQLADHGARDVLGVEIRREQVAQAQLVQRLAGGRFDRVRFEHEPVSADHAGFRAGETYDVVLSMGLLYHLTDPVRHLRNLRRLTTNAAMIHTFTHARERGYWLLVEEDPAGITKAWEGVSWVPHYLDVSDLLRRVGFRTVEIVAAGETAELQRWDARQVRRATRLALPGAVVSAVERARARRYLPRVERALRRGYSPRYYTYIARV